jgi:hypothetical protein
MEANILETFNYNIIIPHYITEIFQTDVSEDQIHPILFLCELFMLRGFDIFFEKEKIEDIIRMVQRVRSANGEELKS